MSGSQLTALTLDAAATAMRGRGLLSNPWIAIAEKTRKAIAKKARRPVTAGLGLSRFLGRLCCRRKVQLLRWRRREVVEPFAGESRCGAQGYEVAVV